MRPAHSWEGSPLIKLLLMCRGTEVEPSPSVTRRAAVAQGAAQALENALVLTE